MTRRERRKMSDSEWLLDLLSDGRPHTLSEILRRSFRERGHGLTVHSRASDLRAKGHNVAHYAVSGDRGDGHVYRLEPPLTAAPADAADVDREVERLHGEPPQLALLEEDATNNKPWWA